MLVHSCLPEPLFDYNQEQLYDYYIKKIISEDIRFYGNQVRFFDTPVVDGYQQGFHHISTKKDKKLKIRFLEQRAHYINWIVPMLKNVSYCLKCDEESCPKIYVWTGIKKGVKRKKLLVEENDIAYLVVLEMKKNLWYVITGFLMDKNNNRDLDYLNETLAEYAANNPSISKNGSYTTS